MLLPLLYPWSTSLPPLSGDVSTITGDGFNTTIGTTTTAGLSSGQHVLFADTGQVELDGNTFTVTVVDSVTFTVLSDINGAVLGGGTWTRVP